MLRRAHQLSVGLFEEQCRSLGLTPSQYTALSVLAASPGMDQSSLARSMGFDKVTTLRLVRGLEQRQLVQRSLNLHDKRQHQLTLTEAGQELLVLAAPFVDAAYQKLIHPLSQEELSQLLALLTKLEADLGPGARVRFTPLNTLLKAGSTQAY